MNNPEAHVYCCPTHRTTHLRAGGVCPLCERIGRAELSVVADAENSQAEAETMETTLCDPFTGELHDAQMTLDLDMFPAVAAASVPTVRVSFSGTIEMTEAEWAARCDDRISTGHEVTINRLHGYVPAPHVAWVQRSETVKGERRTWRELEGRFAIKVLDIGIVEVGGEYEDE